MDNSPRRFIHDVAETLTTHEVLSTMYHQGLDAAPMPSIRVLQNVVEKLRAVIFPGYFGSANMKSGSMKYYIGVLIDEIYVDLITELRRGYCFVCSHESETCIECEEKAREISQKLIEKLPYIRHMLSTDALAAYEGDPASRNVGEVIFCYPSIRALTNYRIAHELFTLEVPLIPRIITEMAHSETGIDIHPGASIDERCFIDHGTGVVIGETCRIGRNVRIYQGVTLGAKSFPLDKNGNPIKGIDRHPKVEDDVIIYSGATILGNITIGRGSVIGGNVWLTEDTQPGSRIRA
ncbi:MAG: serine O-acetyltransferase EpsC [Spirochaetota bacterium]